MLNKKTDPQPSLLEDDISSFDEEALHLYKRRNNALIEFDAFFKEFMKRHSFPAAGYRAISYLVSSYACFIGERNADEINWEI